MTQNESPTPNSRRSFLKTVAISAFAVPALVQIVKSSAAFAAPAVVTPGKGTVVAAAGTPTAVPAAKADGPALDPSIPLAKQLGYHHNVAEVDAKAFPRKAAGQKCKSCVLFQKGGLKADGKSGEWGKCGLFPTGLVNVEGWCNSFAMKVSVS